MVALCKKRRSNFCGDQTQSRFVDESVQIGSAVDKTLTDSSQNRIGADQWSNWVELLWIIIIAAEKEVNWGHKDSVEDIKSVCVCCSGVVTSSNSPITNSFLSTLYCVLWSFSNTRVWKSIIEYNWNSKWYWKLINDGWQIDLFRVPFRKVTE